MFMEVEFFRLKVPQSTTLSCCRLHDMISAGRAYHPLWMFPHDKHYDLDPTLSKETGAKSECHQ